MTISDHRLRESAFGVNAFACRAAADVLARANTSKPEPMWSAISKDHQFAFKVAFVAICHQINWDFLQSRMAKEFLKSPALFIERLAEIRAEEVGAWLEGYERPERISAPERAALLRDLGKGLVAHYQGSPVALLRASNRLISGEHGLLSRLQGFAAFRADPLKKKSNILVQELVREGIADFDDEDKIEPGVDYHLIRLYLRSGRVVPLDDRLASYLQGRPRPRKRLVTMLRAAVSQAVVLTSRYASLSVSTVNYLEWQIGRSICLKDNPRCTFGSDLPLPHEIAGVCQGGCPLREHCPAFSNSDWLSLREPEFRSVFY